MKRISDETLRDVVRMIAKIDTLEFDDPRSTFGDILRACAVELHDLRARLDDDALAREAASDGERPLLEWKLAIDAYRRKVRG